MIKVTAQNTWEQVNESQFSAHSRYPNLQTKRMLSQFTKLDDLEQPVYFELHVFYNTDILYLINKQVLHITQLNIYTTCRGLHHSE